MGLEVKGACLSLGLAQAAGRFADGGVVHFLVGGFNRSAGLPERKGFAPGRGGEVPGAGGGDSRTSVRCVGDQAEDGACAAGACEFRASTWAAGFFPRDG